MTQFSDNNDYFKNIQDPLWFPEETEDDSTQKNRLETNCYYRGLDKQIDEFSKVFELFVPNISTSTFK